MATEEKDRTEARQGETPGVMRWVLIASTALAVVLLLLAFGVV